MKMRRSAFRHTWMLLPFLLLVPVSKLQAQRVDLTTGVELGTGTDTNAAGALRLDLRAGRWGLYARAAARSAGGGCLDSLPPYCTYPDDWADEYAFGATYTRALGGVWKGQASLGGGFFEWNGRDGFLDAGLELQRVLTGPLGLRLGVHSVYAPGVERPRNGELPIVHRKDVVFVGATAGLSLGVGRW